MVIMTIDNLINLVAAIIVGGGTLFLGIMAWRSICQTRSIQRAEKRERLLNEIIEWGLEVSRVTSVSAFTRYAEVEDIQKQRLIIVSDLLGKFTSLETRGKYIKQIALKLENSLGNVVEEVIINIKERNKLLVESFGIRSGPPLDELLKITEILNVNGEALDGLSDGGKKIFDLGKNFKTLGESVYRLIEEATKIKIRDIG